METCKAPSLVSIFESIGSLTLIVPFAPMSEGKSTRESMHGMSRQLCKFCAWSGEASARYNIDVTIDLKPGE